MEDIKKKIINILRKDFDARGYKGNEAVSAIVDEIILPLAKKAFEDGQGSIECYGGRVTQSLEDWIKENIK